VTAASLSTIAPASESLHNEGQAPLSREHLAQLDQARAGRKKINRAIVVAGFNAWTLAVFAVFSLPFIFFDLKGGCVGIGLALISIREFSGMRKLKQLDPAAPRHLGWNQVALCGLIALYCGWQIYNALTGPSQYAESIATTPELASTLKPIDEMITMVTLAVYGCILVIGVALQGLTAAYYFSRHRHLQAYIDKTPRWIIELQRRS